MLIENWVFGLIVATIFLFGLIGVCGWIKEGEMLAKERRENKRLRFQVNKLATRLARLNATENIKVANEYANSDEEGK